MTLVGQCGCRRQQPFSIISGEDGGGPHVHDQHAPVTTEILTEVVELPSA